ncbi:glycosyltransferase family 4 protein [Micromonospora sp. URMC 105]|uniref:glycosyltransferase family 4 protein n=1 Tax=Micromonospora sp. URMC 105 TaxID=3423413 RepID=UPI003F1BBF2D
MSPASPGIFARLAAREVPVASPQPPLPTGGTRTRSVARHFAYMLALGRHARALSNNKHFRDADLIHANTAAAAIIAAPAAAKHRIPMVVHIRDMVSPSALGRAGFEAFTKLALPKASGLIANSQATLSSALPFVPDALPRAVLQSPVGINSKSIPTPVPEVRTIGMVGRLQHWKGQHVFLEAFALACGDAPMRAVIAGAPLFGETEYAEALQRLAARLGIEEKVDFLGHVEDVNALLDSLDVLVHASIRPEPMGQTVLQALAKAKPLIATEGGGPSEWLITGVNGLLVKPNDPMALADALVALVGSQDLRRRVSHGAAETRLMTDAECAEAHKEFFRQVLSNSGSPVGAS